MLDLVRQVQVLLLAVLLIGGGAAKLWHAPGARPAGHHTGPTALFPVRLRRPAVIALCVTEFSLGACLLLTAGSAGAGNPAAAVRAAAVLLFGTGAAALYELRARRANAGWGRLRALRR